MKSDKIKEFASNVHFLFTFFFTKKEGKNQAGLNCEYNSLSELLLILSHSNERFSNERSSNKMWSIRTF